MPRILLLVVVLLTAALPLLGQSPCGETDYARALCAYRKGELAEASRLFMAISASEEPSPESLKSRYFLARVRMKEKKWKEASEQLVAIYSLSPAFYREWNGDFLLGQCRRALGQD